MELAVVDPWLRPRSRGAALGRASVSLFIEATYSGPFSLEGIGK